MSAHIKERRKKVIPGKLWCSWHRKHEPTVLFGKSSSSSSGYQCDCTVGRQERHKRVFVPNGHRSTDHSGRGYTAELVVTADINERCRSVGGWAYLNPVPFTPDDVFAKTSLGWRTVQVKTAGVFRTENGWSLRRTGTGIKSEILALVAPELHLVRYIGLKSPLPKELPEAPTKLFDGVLCVQSTSTDVKTAKTKSNSVKARSKSSTAKTAASKGKTSSGSLVTSGQVATGKEAAYAIHKVRAVPHAPESRVEA